ncbi:MAG: branched-chain amino acid ABC transporter permease [Acidimicrobiia bacterium]
MNKLPLKIPSATTLIGIACVVGVALWANGDRYQRTLVYLGAMYALLAMALYVPYILAGAVSMAFAAYLSIGGLSVGLVAENTGWPLLAAVPIGVVISMVLAIGLGLLTHRLTGFHLAAVTLLFALAFVTWHQESSITKGAGGLSILRTAHLGSIRLTDDALVVFTLLIVALTAIGIDRLRRSPIGPALGARKEAPAAAEACGYSTKVLLLVALAAGAAIASVAGSLFTISNGAVTSGTFSTHIVFLAIFMPILGGSRSAWGAVLGASIVVYLTFELKLLEDGGTFGFLLTVLAILIVAPKGLLGLMDKMAAMVRSRLAQWRGSSHEEPVAVPTDRLALDPLPVGDDR